MTALDSARAEIAARALQQVGTPFRLYGRSCGKALDCVGLAAAAIGPLLRGAPVAAQYSLKGAQLGRIVAALETHGFERLPNDADFRAGDILAVAPGPLQLHLMVRASGGWVHADAGVGHVVFRPGELPWPVVGAWRLGRI